MKGSSSGQDRQKLTFSLSTSSKDYFLSADSEAELNEWVSCLTHVCRLKLADDDKQGK